VAQNHQPELIRKLFYGKQFQEVQNESACLVDIYGVELYSTEILRWRRQEGEHHVQDGRGIRHCEPQNRNFHDNSCFFFVVDWPRRLERRPAGIA
jgi:hypothetical protein